MKRVGLGEGKAGGETEENGPPPAERDIDREVKIERRNCRGVVIEMRVNMRD